MVRLKGFVIRIYSERLFGDKWVVPCVRTCCESPLVSFCQRMLLCFVGTHCHSSWSVLVYIHAMPE